MYQIDSHCHVWELSRNDYDWMDVNDPALTPIAKDFSIKDYMEASAYYTAEKIVLVQAAATEAETEYLLSIADKTPLVSAVVGWVDLTSENALNSIENFRQNKKFRGIRPMLQDIEDTNWLIDKPDQNLWQTLAKNNLSFDALVKPWHLDMITKFCAEHDYMDIVIDHAAKPQWPDESFDLDQYMNYMAEIAANSRAYCKISGLLTELSQSQNLNAEQYIAPVVNHLIECFGSNRLMWGSDWPVVNLVSDYSSWYEMSKQLFSSLSETDQQNIFRNTAENFYRLGGNA